MPKRTKTSGKSESAEAALRSRIIEGKLAPGSRLPTQRDLSGEFHLSPVTLHKAARQLAREGFLRPMGSRGTFVSENPPHLCRYALAFPSQLDGVKYWTDYWTTLQQAAASVVRADPRKQIVSFYDITGHGDVEDYQRLIADVRARRLAGVILLTPPYALANTPLMDDCPVPRVHLGSFQSQFNIPAVGADLYSFVDRALAHVAGQSRRRPVFLCNSIDIDVESRTWSEACRRHGIATAPWQVMSMPQNKGARHFTQVLMMLPPERRPDALIVADDHFVEEVTAGLLASNLPESELPTVIGHANFPKPPRALLPVTFLGYDSVQTIRACLNVLDAQSRGETPPHTTPISAIFASELSIHGGADVPSQMNFPTIHANTAG